MTPDRESGIISLVAKRKLRFLHTQGKKFAFVIALRGGVSEWFKELVLKTSDPARDQGFESLPLRHISKIRRNTQEAEGAPLLRE